MKQIIQRGAEAILYLQNNKLIKERIKKGYRLKEIDEKLRKSRTRREVKLIEKANVPKPRIYDFSDKNMKIEMEFIKGELLRNILDELGNKKRLEICKQIGRQIADLHNSDIIHGDLTTSNMLLWKEKIYFIDFGLGFFSAKVEDKAVDLHLLKQALESKHYQHFEESFKAVLEGYKEKSLNFKAVMDRFEKVESRGRYKRKFI